MAAVPFTIAVIVSLFLTVVTLVIFYFAFSTDHSIETEAERPASESTTDPDM